jgi:hypothetical protein
MQGNLPITVSWLQARFVEIQRFILAWNRQLVGTVEGESKPPMSRQKQLLTTHRLIWGLTSPIKAGSTPLLSSTAIDQRHRPRLHAAPFHRLKSSKTGFSPAS